MALAELTVAVDATFARRRADLSGWDDPYPDRRPPDEAYSRVTDPGRYRIIGARADAWSEVLTERGLAVSFPGPAAWRSPPGTDVTRTQVLVPTAPRAIPLVVARSSIEGVPDAGLTIGVGLPAVPYELVPDCGCDACDSGSDDLVAVVDAAVITVVGGAFRHLADRDRHIIVTADGRRAAGGFRRREIDACIDDPTGWVETTGAAWVQPAASWPASSA